MPSDESLDVGIARIVQTLQEAGVETFESCQGGEGHIFPRPTVRFRGTRSWWVRSSRYRPKELLAGRVVIETLDRN